MEFLAALRLVLSRYSLQTSVRSLSNSLGPNYEYYPELWERILVATPYNVELAMDEFALLNFQVETGSRYHVSFIDEAMDRDS